MSISDASPDQGERQLSPPVGLLFAAICGIIAALMYTGANVALRYCVGTDPFLVAAVKAMPTMIGLAPVLLWMRATDRPILTSTRWIRRFMIVSLIGQFVGNAAFQVSLEYIGLAVAVPITLGVLIIGGALLGRIILFEPVSVSKVVAMATLIAAVVVLSIPTDDVSSLGKVSPNAFLWERFARLPLALPIHFSESLCVKQ